MRRLLPPFVALLCGTACGSVVAQPPSPVSPVQLVPVKPTYKLGSFAYTPPASDGWREVAYSENQLVLVYAEIQPPGVVNTRAQVEAESFTVPDPKVIQDLTWLTEQGQAQQVKERGEKLIAFSKITPVGANDRVLRYALVTRIGAEDLQEVSYVTLAPDKSSYLVAKMTTKEAAFVGEEYFAQCEASMASLADREGANIGSGTCFAVSSDGLLLTANHVVEGADEVVVQFAGGETLLARIVSLSRSTDLALLKVDAQLSSYLDVEPASALHLGDRVFTMGFPLAGLLGATPTFTDGVVSALTGMNGESALLQFTAPIQPGSSGGPLVNESGAVVGVVVSTVNFRWVVSATGAMPQNINYAVKSEYALPLVPKAGRRRTRLSRDAAIENAQHAVCFVSSRAQ